MRAIAMASAALLLCAGSAMCQIPDQFVVHQNDPDPFCPTNCPGGTTILFEMAHAAYVTLEVLTPDTLGVERTLVQGSRAAGLYAVTWDCRDEGGDVVAEAIYPYVFTVSDTAGGTVLFQDMLFATASCATPVEETSWGRIKLQCLTAERPAGE
jgi:hypothetical protein